MSDGHTHGLGPVSHLPDASVRPAAASDAPAVGLVQAQAWSQEYAGLLPEEVVSAFQPEAFARVWRASLSSPPSPAHRLLVACAGAQVVGFAAVGPSEDQDAGESDAELLVLAVHPQARRGGHGSRLLNAAADVVRDAGFETLRTWVPSGAAGGEQFLVAGGFEPDGASRQRVVGPAGDLLDEIRLVAGLGG